MRTRSLILCFLLSFLPSLAGNSFAQQDDSRVWTAEELFQRNVGTRQQMDTQFPPHRIVGNVYYVGTETLASFLIATPEGHVLINSNYERTVPTIRDSVEKLGFNFADVRIVLGSHAHADHMEGDALVKELTGAQVMALEQDVPLLERMRPGGKDHPIDRVLRDGDTVVIGGTTLVARWTPGHTPGCTTWTLRTEENGRFYDVVIIGSMGVAPNTNFAANRAVLEQYRQGFAALHTLPADVGLGSHPAMYNMAEKYARIGQATNPYIDPEGYRREVGIQEAAFKLRLADQGVED